MKIFFQFLFLLLLISSSVFAQDKIHSSGLVNKTAGENLETLYGTNDYKLEEYHYQQWNGTDWNNHSRYHYDYNSAGQHIIFTKWNWEQSSWVENYQDVHEYKDSLEILEINYEWDGTQWVNYLKVEYEYDGNNYLLVRTFYLWDGSAWINSERWQYGVTPGGLTTESLHQVWSGSAWDDEYRDVYEYDSNSNKTLWLRQNRLTSLWVNDYRYNYTYDSNNLLVTSELQEWNLSQFIWKNVGFLSYGYNASNQLTDIISQSWGGTQWINSQRTTYTWDNELQLGYLVETWNGSEWINSTQLTNTYDENDNKTIATFQLWNGSAWLNSYRFLYYYLLITDVEDEIASVSDYSLSQNYPNPFNPSTRISWQSSVGSYQTLKVYDVTGNEIATLVDEYRNAGSYEIVFNVAQESFPAIASGIYFYQLKAGDYLETKKMILIK